MEKRNKELHNSDYQQIDGIKIPKEKPVNKESPARSIAKAISWRIVASGTTFLVFFFTVGKQEALQIILTAVGFEAIAKMIIYYAHERVWANVLWGKKWMKYKFIRRIKLEYIRFKRRKNANRL